MQWLDRWLGKKPKTLELTADLRKQIRRNFNEAARDEEHFPSTIDPRIYHVKLVTQHLGDLAGKRVLDAGCGKGRFARILKDNTPHAEVHAMDLAEAMLQYAASDLVRCAGSLTALPYATECFDGAYATESLEHAVEIEKAVAELCRVVKPGGKIIVIDKNVEHWGKLETPTWERWFNRQEMEGMLRKHCRTVSSMPISYWEDVEPDGMFLAWLAEK